MARVFIGIGSNQGDRLANISRATRELGSLPGVTLKQMATILETEPVGGPPQDPYLNTVIEIETTLPPRELLARAKSVEQQLGRHPQGPRWGPRPIDLDVLLYDEWIVREPGLIIPHEELHRRRFVLEPLAQLAPQLRHPVLKRTITELLGDMRVPAGDSR